VKKTVIDFPTVKKRKESMFTLKETTKRRIEACVSLPFEEICNINFDEERDRIKPIGGGKVVFSTKKDVRKVGRGSPTLARYRFRTMDYVDAGLSRVIYANA